MIQSNDAYGGLLGFAVTVLGVKESLSVYPS